MKRLIQLLTFITFLASTNSATAQILDLTSFDLVANYELSSNGDDLTGTQSAIVLENPVFSFGGVWSRGCTSTTPTVVDSCLIITPEISELDDNAFAIQTDFRASEFGKPIFYAGTANRYLGLETNSNGELLIVINNFVEGTITNLNIQLDEWYNIAVVHNRSGFVTKVYFENELIFTEESLELNQPSGNNFVSNADFGSSNTFTGYIKNLKIYSTNDVVSTFEINNGYTVSVFPNPTNATLSFDLPENKNLEYIIYDVNGRIIKQAIMNDKLLNVKNLQIGLYTIILYQDGEIIGSARFMKN